MAEVTAVDLVSVTELKAVAKKVAQLDDFEVAVMVVWKVYVWVDVLVYDSVASKVALMAGCWGYVSVAMMDFWWVVLMAENSVE